MQRINLKKLFAAFKTDYRIITGCIIAFLMLLLSYLLTLLSNRQLITQIERVNHTNKVISDLEALLSSVKDGETGLRGFIASKDTVFLAPFYKSLLHTDRMHKSIASQTQQNIKLQQSLATLHRLIEEKYNNIQRARSHFIKTGYQVDSVLVNYIYAGKNTMDSLRLLVAEMQQQEKTQLYNNVLQVQRKYAAINSIVITSLVLAFIFAGFGVVTFFRETRARQFADKKVEEYQQQLQQQIEELDQANKELIEIRREEKFASTGRIARMIAHEVRNPLTNIDLALAQIKDELKKENDDTDFLFDIVKRNSNRINQLITELLNATRIEDLQLKTTSLNQLLDEAVAQAKDRIELDNIKLVKNYTRQACDIQVDEEKIKIAFLNILINGIEAMKDTAQPVLHINTYSNGKQCAVTFTDNGIGMDAVALSKLFEAYYSTKPNGNGLGLTNTQNIVLNHKGSIAVESKPGKGSSFTLTFSCSV
ncbi:MAG: hypothetical protein RL172_2029 [Bacteroidota bacterium]